MTGMKLLKRLKRIVWRKQSLFVCAGIGIVFVVLNAGMYAAYRNRTYPSTRVGTKSIGSVSYTEVTQAAASHGVLPKEVTLTYGEKSVVKSTDELGISLDRPALEQQARRGRSWLPIINVFKAHRVAVRTRLEEAKFAASFATVLPEYERPAEDAKLTLDNGTFAIKDPIDGQTLEASKTKQAITDSLAQGADTIALPVEVKSPAVSKAALEEQLKGLQTQQNTTITLSYNGKSRKATLQEVASWYVVDGANFVLSVDKIKSFVNTVGASYGIRVQNVTDVANSIKSSVSASKPLEAGLVAAPIARKTYNYCLATRGVEASHLSTLNAKLLSVYSDPRGWNLDGLVNLNRADTGCVMTVWLSAASQMSSFGAICDSDWSCRVGANVVINFDRWQGASAAWNAAGGSLDDYRSMVINHETGHWFGFYHANCGGAGQPAPVMQQQSISLQGCAFNPWPLASEKAALKAQLGL